MNPTTACLIIGWLFLVTSFLVRFKDKDTELTVRLILSAFATGIFIANGIFWLSELKLIVL